MSATNQTTNFNLPLYQENDATSWLVDFNGAMRNIDENMANISISANNASEKSEENKTEIEKMKEKVENLGSEVMTLTSDVTLSNADVALLKTHSNEQDVRLDNLENKDSALDTEISNLKIKDAELLDKITKNYNTLNGKITENYNTLNGKITENYNTLNDKTTNLETKIGSLENMSTTLYTNNITCPSGDITITSSNTNIETKKYSDYTVRDFVINLNFRVSDNINNVKHIYLQSNEMKNIVGTFFGGLSICLGNSDGSVLEIECHGVPKSRYADFLDIVFSANLVEGNEYILYINFKSFIRSVN